MDLTVTGAVMMDVSAEVKAYMCRVHAHCSGPPEQLQAAYRDQIEATNHNKSHFTPSQGLLGKPQRFCCLGWPYGICNMCMQHTTKISDVQTHSSSRQSQNEPRVCGNRNGAATQHVCAKARCRAWLVL